MAKAWPDESVQGILGAPWWEPCKKHPLQRGQLVWTWVPFPDKDPLCLIPEGRQTATQHDQVLVTVKRMTATMSAPKPHPPVAALPHHDGESYMLHRAKRRPAIVLTLGGETPSKQAFPGASPANLRPKMLLAPYYGADKTDTRGGYPLRLIDRIQHAEYPQYFWDRLPVSPDMGSILRLDHAFAGDDSQLIEPTEWKLNEARCRLLAEWMHWLVSGEIAQETDLALVHGLLQDQ